VHASHISGVRPNPVSLAAGRGGSTIQLALTNSAAQAPVRVDVLDLNGRLVRSVFDATLPGGVSSVCWDGRDALGHPVGAGIYYARLATSEGVDSRRIVVVK
jgi:flagellar hook assembly protein FlgD